jgi:hypothetical protein
MSAACERVLALVSGLPSSRRYSRFIGMLQGYFDGSTQDGQALIFAGYIAQVQTWLNFTDPWQAFLDEDGGRPFKMSRAAKTAKGMCRAQRHYELIDSLPILGAGIVIPIQELKKIVSEFALPRNVANPYYIAWRAMLTMCFSPDHIGVKEPIEFIFDDQTERKNIDRAWDYFKATIPRSYKKKLAGRPSFKRDDDVLPLQAADLIAWWGRHQYVRGNLEHAKLFPSEWTAGRPNKTIFSIINEEGLRAALTKDMAASLRARDSLALKVPMITGPWPNFSSALPSGDDQE